jgi:hypothetical protein
MKRAALALLIAFGSVHAAFAVVMTESFPDPLGGWKTRFLGQNSDLQNYYVVAGNGNNQDDRGNNPTGLWIAQGTTIGGDSLTITFNPTFGNTVTSVSFGIESFNNIDVRFYNGAGSLVSTQNAFGGNFPLDHTQVLSVGSMVGLSRIEFDSAPHGGGQIEGNTSIDDFSVNVAGVPEPASMIAIGAGVAALLARRRKKA